MAKKKLFNFKLSKQDKKILGTTAKVVGVLALVGASGEVAKRLRR